MYSSDNREAWCYSTSSFISLISSSRLFFLMIHLFSVYLFHSFWFSIDYLWLPIDASAYVEVDEGTELIRDHRKDSIKT